MIEIRPLEVRIGDLDCYVIQTANVRPTAQGNSALVILCHGYGAPGSDMVGIVGEWMNLLGDAVNHFRFICPIAPHSLADQGLPSGRAWWPLNMARLMESVQTNRFEELHNEIPPGIDDAQGALAETIRLAKDEFVSHLGTDDEHVRLAIGGFSQGAMLTMDTAVSGNIPAPDLLLQFSGTVVCQPRWTASLSRLEKTWVYQSHGTLDPVLPFSSAERLRDLIASAKIDAQFHSFTGPHTIDLESIAETAVLLKRLIEEV